VGQSDFLPLVIGLGQVLIILLFEPLDRGVQFKLVFPLDGEDLVLKFGHKCPQTVLRILMVFELPAVASDEESNLFVLFGEGGVEVVDFLEQGVLNQLGEPA
jgi:hypothetical protein